jgi:hypothetical protein
MTIDRLIDELQRRVETYGGGYEVEVVLTSMNDVRRVCGVYFNCKTNTIQLNSTEIEQDGKKN